MCSIGCYWQLQLLASKYFAYEVSTVVTLIDHELITPPSLAVCFQHHLLRPFSKIPENIARLTPSANESYERIVFRSESGSLVFAWKGQKLSNSNYTIKRHFSFRTACYSYGFRSNLRINNRLKIVEMILDVNNSLISMSRDKFLYVLYDSNEMEPPFVGLLN